MTTIASTFFIAIAVAGSASVMAANDHAGHTMVAQAGNTASSKMVDGLVKKVDKDAGKLTLSHGPLESLNMPAMTMVFRVKEASWLDQMKTGDKIMFVAESINGTITVTHFVPVK